MTLRAAASEAFPVTVCESPLTNMAPGIGPVAILGDTGCRIEVKDGKQDIQDCVNQWLFAQIIQNIASSKPSFVIHVGDYVYRESACPDGILGCANSPYGDNWATWKIEFFDSAVNLLSQTTWLFMRGNHELCSRNAQGWFRFLDPHPYTGICSDYTEPYLASYAGLNLIVVDNSAAEDSTAEIYAKQFELTKSLVKERNWNKAWLLLHEPIWGANVHKKILKTFSPTMQEAFKSAPSEVELVLSGHVHFFQTVSFNDHLPNQVIVGTGGVELDKWKSDLSDVVFPGRSNAQIKSLSQFGHVLLTQTSNGHAFDFVSYDSTRSIVSSGFNNPGPDFAIASMNHSL
ncbi:MAG: metallophosphoesterase [Myxococcaceae bacterium]